jgi:hypothetical protein
MLLHKWNCNRPEDYGSFSQMSRGSLFFVRTVDVVGNASPTLAFFERDRFRGGSVMVLGGISHRLKSPLIVIAGN